MPVHKVSFIQAVESINVPTLLAILNREATGHADTPSSKVKNEAIKLIRSTLQHFPEKLYTLAVQLVQSDDPIGEEIGVSLLVDHYDIHPAEISGHLQRLADSPHWEVREWVASACGTVLRDHFAEFYNVMMQWTRSESPNVRRTVAVAVKYAGKSRDKAYADPLLDLLEPLLSDADPYVKKNLGAFAIGDGLLRYFPEKVIERVTRWVDDENEHVRWNVAKIFSSAEGMKHVGAMVQVMSRLRSDSRPVVKRAVDSTLKAIAERKQETFKEIT